MQSPIPLWPEQASAHAAELDLIIIVLTVITVFFTLLIAAVLLYAAVRYRRSAVTGLPKSVEGYAWLEITWSVIPLMIVMGVFVWATQLYFKMLQPPADALEIYVVGKQWMWKVQHPDGQREINALHVPVGQPVKLILTSEDVIHSFGLPEFRSKHDVIPGKYTSMYFTPTKAGTWRLYCNQYCGTEHSKMVGYFTALEPADYQRWLSERTDGSMATEGRKLFSKLQCIACHNAESSNRAPNLEQVFGRRVPLVDGGSAFADENYLRESILNPTAKIVAGYQPIMPKFNLKRGDDDPEGQVTEEELLRVIAFIKSLQPGGTPPRVNSQDAPEVKVKAQEEKK